MLEPDNPSTVAESTAADVVVIGGGVVGVGVLFALAHRGVDVLLLEAESGLAYGASGTNSGILHTGFDSVPGELETDLILRAARLRPTVMNALGVPVVRCGAVLAPRNDDDLATINELATNAAENGVEVHVRDSDAALLIPGETVTDPVAFTGSLAAAAEAEGARIELGARVVEVEAAHTGLVVRTQDCREVRAAVVVNCAGLRADEIAGLIGDRTFEIYPRKGEFFVFDPPAGAALDHIILPVPSKRTKGVLVFPTVDGKIVAGPTAVDLTDKDDWTVRKSAWPEIMRKAVDQYPALDGLSPIAKYAGLRPAGRDANYVIGSSEADARLINVAAIRSTGLTASLGIGDYVSEMLPVLGVAISEWKTVQPLGGQFSAAAHSPWWSRTAARVALRG